MLYEFLKFIKINTLYAVPTMCSSGTNMIYIIKSDFKMAEISN